MKKKQRRILITILAALLAQSTYQLTTFDFDEKFGDSFLTKPITKKVFLTNAKGTYTKIYKHQGYFHPSKKLKFSQFFCKNQPKNYLLYWAESSNKKLDLRFYELEKDESKILKNKFDANSVDITLEEEGKITSHCFTDTDGISEIKILEKIPDQNFSFKIFKKKLIDESDFKISTFTIEQTEEIKNLNFDRAKFFQLRPEEFCTLTTHSTSSDFQYFNFKPESQKNSKTVKVQLSESEDKNTIQSFLVNSDDKFEKTLNIYLLIKFTDGPFLGSFSLIKATFNSDKVEEKPFELENISSVGKKIKGKLSLLTEFEEKLYIVNRVDPFKMEIYQVNEGNLDLLKSIILPMEIQGIEINGNLVMIQTLILIQFEIFFDLETLELKAYDSNLKLVGKSKNCYLMNSGGDFMFFDRDEIILANNLKENNFKGEYSFEAFNYSPDEETEKEKFIVKGKSVKDFFDQKILRIFEQRFVTRNSTLRLDFGREYIQSNYFKLDEDRNAYRREFIQLYPKVAFEEKNYFYIKMFSENLILTLSSDDEDLPQKIHLYFNDKDLFEGRSSNFRLQTKAGKVLNSQFNQNSLFIVYNTKDSGKILIEEYRIDNQFYSYQIDPRMQETQIDISFIRNYDKMAIVICGFLKGQITTFVQEDPKGAYLQFEDFPFEKIENLSSENFSFKILNVGFFSKGQEKLSLSISCHGNYLITSDLDLSFRRYENIKIKKFSNILLNPRLTGSCLYQDKIIFLDSEKGEVMAVGIENESDSYAYDLSFLDIKNFKAIYCNVRTKTVNVLANSFNPDVDFLFVLSTEHVKEFRNRVIAVQKFDGDIEYSKTNEGEFQVFFTIKKENSEFEFFKFDVTSDKIVYYDVGESQKLIKTVNFRFLRPYKSERFNTVSLKMEYVPDPNDLKVFVYTDKKLKIRQDESCDFRVRDVFKIKGLLKSVKLSYENNELAIEGGFKLDIKEDISTKNFILDPKRQLKVCDNYIEKFNFLHFMLVSESQSVLYFFNKKFSSKNFIFPFSNLDVFEYYIFEDKTLKEEFYWVVMVGKSQLVLNKFYKETIELKEFMRIDLINVLKPLNIFLDTNDEFSLRSVIEKKDETSILKLFLLQRINGRFTPVDGTSILYEVEINPLTKQTKISKPQRIFSPKNDLLVIKNTTPFLVFFRPSTSTILIQNLLTSKVSELKKQVTSSIQINCSGYNYCVFSNPNVLEIWRYNSQKSSQSLSFFRYLSLPSKMIHNGIHSYQGRNSINLKLYNPIDKTLQLGYIRIGDRDESSSNLDSIGWISEEILSTNLTEIEIKENFVLADFDNESKESCVDNSKFFSKKIGVLNLKNMVFQVFNQSDYVFKVKKKISFKIQNFDKVVFEGHNKGQETEILVKRIAKLETEKKSFFRSYFFLFFFTFSLLGLFLFWMVKAKIKQGKYFVSGDFDGDFSVSYYSDYYNGTYDTSLFKSSKD